MRLAYCSFFVLFLFFSTVKATDIFGRISIRSYRISDQLNENDLKAHGFGIHLNARNIWSSGFNFYVRYRAGKAPNYYSSSKSKLYDLTLSADHIWGNLGFAIGRLNTPIVGAYGILDGFRLHYQIDTHYYFGGFWGTEPDLLSYEMKDDIKRSGMFFQIDYEKNYQGNFSIIRQTYLNKLDRVYLYVDNEIDWSDAWSFAQFAEIDLVEKGENGSEQKAFRLTDVFADVRFSPVRSFSAILSYTTHKEFKYLESMSDIPDSLFESSVDQSLGLRLNLRPFGRWRFYSRLRYGITTAESGQERFLSLGAANYNLLSTGLFVNARYAQHDGYFANSNSWYFSVERELWSGFRMRMAYRQSVTDYSSAPATISTKAYDFVFTYNLSWNLYLYLKGTRMQGDDINESRLFLELSYNIRSYTNKRRP